MSDTDEYLDERRLQVQTYHEWLRVANGKDFPTLHEMVSLEHPRIDRASFVLDLTDDFLAPTFLQIGDELLRDCPNASSIHALKDVPKKTLISRLSEHYLQCLSNRAPVGFEAGFENTRNETIKYRGIILPLSSDGETIDYIWGTINSTVDCEPGSVDLSPLEQMEPSAYVDDVIDALTNERRDLIERVGSKLETLAAIDGVNFVALVDRESRAPFATHGKLASTKIDTITTGCAKALSELQSMLENLALQDEAIEAMQITFESQAYLIHPITDISGKGLFVLMVLDQLTDNAAMALFKVRKFENEISNKVSV